VKSFESLEIHLRIPDLWQQQALASLRHGRDVERGRVAFDLLPPLEARQ
jgi:hypothetical protein